MPLLVGGGVVVVGAILALTSGGDDKGGESASSVKPAASATGAAAQPATFALPRSPKPLSRDTVVYASNRSGNYDLFTAQVTDDNRLLNEKPLITDSSGEVLPVISRDRRTVVFFKKDSPKPLQAIAADGSGKPVQLLAAGAAAHLALPDDSRPSLSPDGGSLVVRSTSDATGAALTGLYIVKLADGSVSRIENAAE